MMNEFQEKGNDPLADVLRDITSRKQWTEELLTRVKTIRKSRGANRSKELSRLESEILLHIDPRQNEALIDEKILEANTDFIEKLKKRFQGLTENELLFCAYIRMNLGNTDIAALKDINTKSVNMARYRLKKKLRLDPEQELDEYLQHFKN
jgi:hypothetical protein